MLPAGRSRETLPLKIRPTVPLCASFLRSKAQPASYCAVYCDVTWAGLDVAAFYNKRSLTSVSYLHRPIVNEQFD
jgi:hypothetical protein